MKVEVVNNDNYQKVVRIGGNNVIFPPRCKTVLEVDEATVQKLKKENILVTKTGKGA